MVGLIGLGCGGDLYNYGGTFSSPGYPSTFRNDSDCTWTITVPMNLHVALHFQGKTIHQLQQFDCVIADESLLPYCI